jgi:hypothetical protein
MSKKIWLPIAIGGAALATGGFGIPAVLAGAKGAAAAAGAAGAAKAGGMSLATKLTLGSLAADAGSRVYGAHQANRASQRATDLQAKYDADAIAFEERDRADRERQWQLQYELDRRRSLGDEDDRLFNRRLIEAREARRGPFREASRQSLGRLSDLMSPAGHREWRSPSNAGRVGSLGDLARRG